MDKLTKTEREFVENYFQVVGSIWQEYFDGRSTMSMFSMSQTKREIKLNFYRSKLNEILRKIK